MAIKIANLNKYPELIPVVAKIWHDSLSNYFSDISIKQVEQGFYNELNDNVLPLTLIALKDAEVIGAISLYRNDEIRTDLTPWIESLVVDKAHQNQGIGKMLVEKAKQKARDLNFKKLYLFAFEPSLVPYYEKLGLKFMAIDRFKKQVVTIMVSIL
ncbi:MAG: GNAT family N-acetyltransferase [Proteobacteria bacterium]|nr:GNAT family N-acetyltransferase [Pseudomonadota bacterium]